MVGLLFGLISLGIAAAWSGVARVPGAGRLLSGAADRTVIKPSPSFLGSVKLPTNVALGSMATTSPGCALLSAACRSCPAPTSMVRPVGGTRDVSTNEVGNAGAGSGGSDPRGSACPEPAEARREETPNRIVTTGRTMRHVIDMILLKPRVGWSRVDSGCRRHHHMVCPGARGGG